VGAASEVTGKQPRRRRWRFIAAASVLLLALLYFGAGLILAPYLKHRLQAMVAAHLNAELQIGSLHYRLPYSVTAYDVTLVTHDHRAPVELFNAKRINLVLAEFPRRNKPLIIKKLILNEPLVRLIKVPPPVKIEGHDLLRRGVHPKPSEALKLSDVLRLRWFTVDNGQIVYVDKTRADHKPMVWGGIHVALNIEPSSASLYTFRIDAKDEPLAQATVEGKMDIDALRLDASRLDLTLAIKPVAKNEQVPAAVQEFIQRSAMSGELKVSGVASIPLKNPAATYDYDLHATLTNAAVRPRAFPLPLRKLNGEIRVTRKSAAVKHLDGQYGADRLKVTAAHVPLDGITHSFRIEDIAGVADFAGVEQPYPKALNATLHVLHPKGPCGVAATCAVPATRPVQTSYHVALHAEGINFDILFGPRNRRIATSDSDVDMAIDGIGKEGTIDVSRGEGDALGGKFLGRGEVKIAKPVKYSAEAHLREIKVHDVAKAWALPGQQIPRLTGRATADATAFGTGRWAGKTTLDQLGGKGEIEITDGDYFQVPVLRDVISAMNLPKDAATVGEGAVRFRVHDRLIDLDRAAVSAPMVGLQGDGAISFDGRLDIRVVAAPLADWKKGLSKNGLPIVGDIAGAIQKLLNGATRLMFYEFRVGGKLPKVEIITVPTPVLTDGVAKLFGKMIAPDQNEKLIDSVRGDTKGK
jgi:hypothetical protein